MVINNNNIIYIYTKVDMQDLCKPIMKIAFDMKTIATQYKPE